jgi:hypothetical protein
VITISNTSTSIQISKTITLRLARKNSSSSKTSEADLTVGLKSNLKIYSYVKHILSCKKEIKMNINKSA